MTNFLNPFICTISEEHYDIQTRDQQDLSVSITFNLHW